MILLPNVTLKPKENVVYKFLYLISDASSCYEQCSLFHVWLTFSLWLDGVLPLVTDRETTAQEKCFQILEEVLLNNIVPQSKLVIR